MEMYFSYALAEALRNLAYRLIRHGRHEFMRCTLTGNDDEGIDLQQWYQHECTRGHARMRYG